MKYIVIQENIQELFNNLENEHSYNIESAEEFL